MWTVRVNKMEQKNRFTFYKTFREARRNCCSEMGEMVCRAVDLYHRNSLGYVVMEDMEADARRAK